MRLLDHYIRNTIITTTGIVLLALTGVYSLLEFISQLSKIGVADYTVKEALLYTLCQMPAGIYQFFPMAGFLGCLIGLGRLSTTHELTVMRTSSVSLLRILYSVTKAALFMLLVVTFIGELLGPMLQEKGFAIRSEALGNRTLVRNQAVWFRNQDTFFYLKKIRSTTEVEGVTLFEFNRKRELVWAAEARRAQSIDGKWWLFDVVGTRFGPSGTHVEHQDRIPLEMKFRPNVLGQPQKVLLQQSLPDLVKTIHYRRQAGLEVGLFYYNLWQRLIQPLTTLVMIALGVPFVFGSMREVSMGSRVLAGIFIGFAFYMLSQFFGPITLIYGFPSWLSALLPTLIFSLIVVLGMRRC